MANHYDVIVLGVGGMGSATVFELARRGRRVLGLEQFDFVHDRGSSHGQTRIIRQAYYESPDYVPLVRRAYERWYDLEQRVGRHLLTECPCLSIGRADSAMIAGVRLSAQQHSLPVETLSPEEIRRRYPPFHFGDEFVGVLERSAGYLYVEECVRAHIEAARALGAIVRHGESVLSWRAERGSVTVQTQHEKYSADRLVITAGPWATQLLARWGAALVVMRQIALWFGVGNEEQYRRDRFPIYIADTPEGHYYGFPVIGPDGAKVARHYGAPELRDPGQIDRAFHSGDDEPVRQFLKMHLPGIDGPRRRSAVCIYTLTPDRHFAIDLHSEHDNVAVAAGFSGHGFKFASVVGEVLADLVDKGSTTWPISRFRLARLEGAAVR